MKATFVSFLLFITFSFPAISQEFKLIRGEAYYGYGYTGIDLDEWVGSTLWNWNQANHGGHVQLFFLKVKSLDLGIQLGYQTLFWYETRTSDGFFPIFRQYSPGATHLMVVGQTGSTVGWFGEFGLGGYSGESISGFALSGGGGYRIGLVNGWGIPIKAKVDALFAEQPMAMATLFVGVSYQINYEIRR